MTKEELRAHRKALNLRQAEFGAMLGVGQSAVSDWERDVSKIPGPAERLAWLLANYPQVKTWLKIYEKKYLN